MDTRCFMGKKVKSLETSFFRPVNKNVAPKLSVKLVAQNTLSVVRNSLDLRITAEKIWCTVAKVNSETFVGVHLIAKGFSKNGCIKIY